MLCRGLSCWGSLLQNRWAGRWGYRVVSARGEGPGASVLCSRMMGAILRVLVACGYRFVYTRAPVHLESVVENMSGRSGFCWFIQMCPECCCIG
jgi:hypothetical protein